MGILDSIWKPIAKPFGLDDAFEDKVTPASPEAPELRRIKLEGARGQKQALDIFRDLTKQDPSAQIRQRIALENLAGDKVRRQKLADIMSGLYKTGGDQSAAGLMALSGIEDSRDLALNKAGFRSRLAGEKERRGAELKQTAASTLADTNIGTRFSDVKEQSLFKNMVMGAGKGFAGSLGSALGSGAAGKKKTGTT